MWHYLLRRLLIIFLPTLLGISVVVFGIMHLIPGSFVDVLVGIGTDITEEQRARLVQAYGLDRPLPVQYLYWLGNLARGDLGTSLRTGKPVLAEIMGRLPVTLEVSALALLMALALAIPLGVLSAVRPNGALDLVARLLALAGLSVPNFLLGTLLILAVSLYLPNRFPTTGYVPLSEGLGANLRSILLPSLTLALALSASLMRITRASLAETLHQEYIRVARSKGLHERRVLLVHALRNGLIPVITLLGIHVGYLLGGTVIVEEIFSLPGIGRLALNAIYQRDYPTVQGTVLFIAVAFVLVNLLTDLAYSLIDPRIRLEQ